MDYIRLKDVYKTMKGTQVLKGVNLTVEQGDIVGIRGINGSGKTMVLRAIAGLIRVDGSVEIGGKKMEPGEWKYISSIRGRPARCRVLYSP